MIILKIFRLKKQIKNIKDGINNPSDFASKNIINILTTYIIIAVIIDLIILTILFLLGYTNIIIKPIGLARFLFWLDLFLTIPVGIFIIFILSLGFTTVTFLIISLSAVPEVIPAFSKAPTTTII